MSNTEVTSKAAFTVLVLHHAFYFSQIRDSIHSTIMSYTPVTSRAAFTVLLRSHNALHTIAQHLFGSFIFHNAPQQSQHARSYELMAGMCITGKQENGIYVDIKAGAETPAK